LEDNNANSNKNLVLSLVGNFRQAFNSHDPNMLSALLTEDGEWIDVIGHTMIGRKEIEHQHVYPFITVLKEARLDVKSHRSKWITDEIVSIDIKWESSGHRTPEGVPISTIRYGLLNVIAKIVKDGVDTILLKIIIAHNNDYTSTYTQSDRERIVKQKWQNKLLYFMQCRYSINSNSLWTMTIKC
jgi:uncharacterized protein (TIGR02246 family)